MRDDDHTDCALFPPLSSSPLAAPPLEQPEDNQQSDTNNNNNDPPRLKSRRRAFTSAAIRPFQWGTSGNSNNNNTNTQPSSSDSPQSQADADASAAQQARHEQMNQRLVDFLDAVDPEIGTVSTLNNIQNSLFVPNLGSWVNRGSLIRLSTPEARAASRYSQLLDEQEKLQEKGQPTTQNRAPADVAASGANDEYAKALEEQRPPHAAASTSGRPGAQSAEPPSAEAQDAEAEKARQRAQSPLQFDDQRLQAPQPPPKTRRRGMSASSAFSGLSAPKLRHRPTVRGEFAVLPVRARRSAVHEKSLALPWTHSLFLSFSFSVHSLTWIGKIGPKRRKLSWTTMCTWCPARASLSLSHLAPLSILTLFSETDDTSYIPRKRSPGASGAASSSTVLIVRAAFPPQGLASNYLITNLTSTLCLHQLSACSSRSTASCSSSGASLGCCSLSAGVSGVLFQVARSAERSLISLFFSFSLRSQCGKQTGLLC